MKQDHPPVVEKLLDGRMLVDGPLGLTLRTLMVEKPGCQLTALCCPHTHSTLKGDNSFRRVPL